jgi:hypothetical protein
LAPRFLLRSHKSVQWDLLNGNLLQEKKEIDDSAQSFKFENAFGLLPEKGKMLTRQLKIFFQVITADYKRHMILGYRTTSDFFCPHIGRNETGFKASSLIAEALVLFLFTFKL